MLTYVNKNNGLDEEVGQLGAIGLFRNFLNCPTCKAAF